MPRDHKRRPGSRRYLDFTDKDVEAAVKAIQEGMSKRDAEKEFGIPKTTLCRRLKGASNKPGRHPVLTMLEDNIIVDRIQIMCRWGFPLDGSDLRYIVKSYLDCKEVNEPLFKNNLLTSKLLKELVGDLNEENLVNGFKNCGIYPLERNQVLSRLPHETNSQEANQCVDECLINMVKSVSGKDDAAPKRGKKFLLHQVKPYLFQLTAMTLNQKMNHQINR